MTTLHSLSAALSRMSSRAAAAAFVGALLEWYDFYIFATASALVFGPVFFPSGNAVVSTMAAFGAFAAGSIARPMGGVLFGHIGDRIGRKASLIATLLIIGLGTFLVGLLPGYAQIGPLAPALLVVLRVMQGIGLGGEYGGASLLAVEHAPEGRRGLWGSLPQAASPAGLLLDTALFSLLALLPTEAFQSWGWRIPFLLSGPMLLVGLRIRLRIAETPDFLRASANPSTVPPLIELLRAHPGATLFATGARLAETVSGNMIKSFGLTYVTLELGLSRSIATNALLLAAAAALLTTPCFGVLGDRLGQQRVYVGGTALLMLLAFPFVTLLGLRSTASVYAAFVLAYTLGPTLMLSVQATFFAQLFRAGVRCTGLSVAYQSSAIIGGLTPLAALWLLHVPGGGPWLVAAALAAVALFSGLCAACATALAPAA